MKKTRNQKKLRYLVLFISVSWYLFLNAKSPEGFFYQTNGENLINFLFREFLGFSQPLRDSEYFVGAMIITLVPYILLCNLLNIPIVDKPYTKPKITRSKDDQNNN